MVMREGTALPFVFPNKIYPAGRGIEQKARLAQCDRRLGFDWLFRNKFCHVDRKKRYVVENRTRGRLHEPKKYKILFFRFWGLIL